MPWYGYRRGTKEGSGYWYREGSGTVAGDATAKKSLVPGSDARLPYIIACSAIYKHDRIECFVRGPN